MDRTRVDTDSAGVLLQPGGIYLIEIDGRGATRVIVRWARPRSWASTTRPWCAPATRRWCRAQPRADRALPGAAAHRRRGVGAPTRSRGGASRGRRRSSPSCATPPSLSRATAPGSTPATAAPGGRASRSVGGRTPGVLDVLPRRTGVVLLEPWGWVPYHYGSGISTLRTVGSGTPDRFYRPAHVVWYWGASYAGWVPSGYYGSFYARRFGFHLSFGSGFYGVSHASWNAYRDWVFCPTSSIGFRNQTASTRDHRVLAHHRGFDGAIERSSRRYARARPRCWRDRPRWKRRSGAVLTGDPAARRLPDVSAVVARNPEVSDRCCATSVAATASAEARARGPGSGGSDQGGGARRRRRRRDATTRAGPPSRGARPTTAGATGAGRGAEPWRASTADAGRTAGERERVAGRAAERRSSRSSGAGRTGQPRSIGRRPTPSVVGPKAAAAAERGGSRLHREAGAGYGRSADAFLRRARRASRSAARRRSRTRSRRRGRSPRPGSRAAAVEASAPDGCGARRRNRASTAPRDRAAARRSSAWRRSREREVGVLRAAVGAASAGEGRCVRTRRQRLGARGAASGSYAPRRTPRARVERSSAPRAAPPAPVERSFAPRSTPPLAHRALDTPRRRRPTPAPPRSASSPRASPRRQSPRRRGATTSRRRDRRRPPESRATSRPSGGGGGGRARRGRRRGPGGAAAVAAADARPGRTDPRLAISRQPPARVLSRRIRAGAPAPPHPVHPLLRRGRFFPGGGALERLVGAPVGTAGHVGANA